MSNPGFMGEHFQRIDAKGRVSIPAEFRRVLEAGDPGWAEGRTPWLVLNYADSIGERLDVRTMTAQQRIAAEIEADEPTDEASQDDHDAAVHFLITQTQAIEVDRDGRIVLPAPRRAKLGIAEGDVVFAGKRDHFEIWAAAAYEVQVSGRMRDYLAETVKASGGRAFNPMTRLRARRA